jgi:dienelactone hydrolase
VKRAHVAGLVAGLAAVIVGGLIVERERIVLSWIGAKTEKRSLAEQEALIAPFIHVFEPAAGAAPFPVVVQFHGCAGYRDDFMAQWAKVATEEGFLVIAVDSGTPRGIDREESLSSVCAGKKLIGQERAGDIAAALALVAARDDVDPGKIVAVGWSHGAWSLMDHIALESAKIPPASLKAAPPPTALAASVLFYPYCGRGSWSRIERWRGAPETLAFVGGADTIVDGPECRARLQKIAAAGTKIELVYYDGADHVFDDATLVGGEYEYFYDAGTHADAVVRYRAFLAGVRARP